MEVHDNGNGRRKCGERRLVDRTTSFVIAHSQKSCRLLRTIEKELLLLIKQRDQFFEFALGWVAAQAFSERRADGHRYVLSGIY